MAIRPGNQDTLVFALELLRRIPRNSKATEQLNWWLRGFGDAV